MKQSDRPGNGFEKINGHAVRSGHREENTASVRRQAVRIAGNADAGGGRRVDHGHSGPVNLPTDDARPAAECVRQRLEPFCNRPGRIGAGETIVIRGDSHSGDETWKLSFPVCMNE
jgi:hypothetical protein